MRYISILTTFEISLEAILKLVTYLGEKKKKNVFMSGIKLMVTETM